MQAFLTQFYLSGGGRESIPTEILVSERSLDQPLLQSVLTAESGRSVSIRVPARGLKARWVALAHENAQLALRQRQGSRARHQDRRLFRIREENVFRKVKGRMSEWLKEVF